MTPANETRTTKIVTEIISEAMRTGTASTAIILADGAPAWLTVDATVAGWAWEADGETGIADCVFDAVWGALTLGTVKNKFIIGAELESARRALVA